MEDHLWDDVVYLRKSKGRAGIARQRRDCEAHSKRTRGRVVDEFSDDDRTAFPHNGKRAKRDGYAQLLEKLSSDRRDPPLRVLVWHADRLHRDPVEVEEFIALARQGGNLIETPKSGSYDLTTAIGRKRLRQDGVDAAYEVDHMVERWESQKTDAAREGKWLGGPVPFGWRRTIHIVDGEEIKQLVVCPEEAEAVREACDAVLAGRSMYAIADDWNARGLTTSRQGKEWDPREVRRVLLRPRNAGFSVHRRQIVGTAEWEPIVTESKWRATLAVLKDPARRTTPGPQRRWLGSGHFLCGVCEAPVRIRSSGGKGRPTRRVYVCRDSRSHVVRDSANLDAFVSAHIIARVSREDAADLLLDDDRPDLEDLHAELTTARGELEEWRQLAENREVSAVAFARAEQKLLDDIDKLEASMAHVDRAPVLAELVAADDPAAEWEAYPIDRKHAVLTVLMTVVVHRQPRGRPAGWTPGSPYFDPDAVEIRWKV